MHNLLMKFTRNKPMRLIEINGDAYLERYHIASVLGLKIWLHRFVRNDSERHLHSHPWHALSIILNGGYREIVSLKGYRNWDIVDYKRGQVNVIKSDKTHRILQVEPNTWTLILRAPRLTDFWFFVDEDNKFTPVKSVGDDWHKVAGNREQTYMARSVAKLSKSLGELHCAAKIAGCSFDDLIKVMERK